MKQLRDRVALVTGAGKGIGREIALALAREGAELIICDVDATALAETSDEIDAISRCLIADKVDVSDRVAMCGLADKVHALVPAVDILVNNAGVGMGGHILDMTFEDWDWIIGINLMGVIHGTHCFVPRMAERGAGGHVVNMSSMMGYWTGPLTAGYSTVKHGVLGLSLCMRADLAIHNIGVSVICPGLIKTNIVSTSRLKGPGGDDELRDKAMVAYKLSRCGPDKVARAVVNAIKRNKALVPVAAEAWFLYYLSRFFPGLCRFGGAIFARFVEKGR